MVNNLSTIMNRYYSILKNTGYTDYTLVLNIILYLALQELYPILEDNKYKDLAGLVLHNLEKNICLISSSTPCITSSNYKCNSFIFGFLDTIGKYCDNDKDIIDIPININRSFSESFSYSFK